MRLSIFFLCFGGCFNTPCFTPPPTSSQEQHDLMLKLAGQISAIPVSPSIETDFKNSINLTYAALSDDNATYFMAASLALCFSKEGKWGRDVAARILIDLETQWKAKTGAKSLDVHPQADQVRVIKESLK